MISENSFVDILVSRATSVPDATAFRFVEQDADPREMTYRELDTAARRIAVRLREQAQQGDRVMLLFAPGLDYVAAFFGALYAGMIAVPSYPPLDPTQAAKLRGIIADATPTVVATTQAMLPAVRDLVATVAEVRWLATDTARADAGDWRSPGVCQETVAFLQYTSGTTSDPRGVVVRHGNLLANSAFIAERFAHTPQSSGVIWLPPYHDMGLIGGILQPVYRGFPVTLMSPLEFLREPIRWLRAIGDYRATTSGGPNFAYDLCLRKIAPERRTELDLSSWKVAFTGAEPVRAQTMRAFTEAFAESGFRPEAFYPCYGLAESTLMVTGGVADRSPTTVRVDPEELSRDRAIPGDGGHELVGCGTPAPGHDLRIVDASGCELRDSEVGEIWVRGPSVANGYWSGPSRAEGFDGWCDGEGPYLRTGDRGFRCGSELFPVDRISDVVIIRGRNYSPGDIERAAAGCDSGLRAGCTAAFTVGTETGTRLCVVQELDRVDRMGEADAGELVDKVRAAVVRAHGLAPDTVALIAKGALPKTTSGKVRRRACRDALLDGSLAPVNPEPSTVAEPSPGPAGLIRVAAAAVLGVAAELIALDRPLTAMGLDSVGAVELRAAVRREHGLLLPLRALLAGASCATLADTDTDTTPQPTPAVSDELTSNEAAMWFLQRLTPESRAYHLCYAVDITGSVPDSALDRAVREITSTHAAFRTRFPARDGQPHRELSNPSVRVDHVDASGWDDASVDGALAGLAEESIDLAEGPLWRLRHWAIDRDRHVIALSTHHIVADLWSLTLVVRQLLGHLSGETDTGVAPSMAEVAAAEAAYLGSAEAQADASAWRRRLAGLAARTELPADYSRPADRRGAGYRFAFDERTTLGVLALARERGVTAYSVLLASLYALLHRYTGASDLVVGAPTPGRALPESHGVVGMCVNTVPVRCPAPAGESFGELIDRASDRVTSALVGGRYPFADLVKTLPDLPRDGGRNPLFDIVLAWQQAPGRDPLAALAIGCGECDLAGLTVRAHPIAAPVTPFDLSIDAVEYEGELACHVRYHDGRWDRRTIEGVARHWQSLLATACADPSTKISDLPLIDETERRQLLEVLAPRRGTVRDRPLDEAVRRFAQCQPDTIVVRDGQAAISYRQLDARATRGAAWLRRLGVGPEVTVGVLIRRSASFVLAAVTVLRAGGAFVPLDPDHPAGRLAEQVKDAQLLLIVTDECQQSRGELIAELGHEAPRFVDVGDGSVEAVAPQHADVAPPPRPHNTAYVMYTSGTTGVPKGVSVPRTGVVNLLDDIANRAPLRVGDACSWWTNAAFDLAVYEVFTALTAGATLMVVPQRVHAEPATLAMWIAQQEISCAYVPSFALDALAQRAERAQAQGAPLALRRLMVGVEPVGMPVLRRLAAAIPGVRILNAYGPTEATIISAVYDGNPSATDAELTPIGSAMRNNPLYLLDSGGDAVPLGTYGEIYVGGVGVARGYLNQPSATAERYLPDPWTPGTRMYRTGDFGRWGRDHQLRFVGRRDDQVKLRGVRIELGEVESVLRTQDRVSAARATVCEINGNRVLVGYVAATEDDTLSKELLAHCRARLPAAMVPSAIVVLDALPTTESGKLDRAALPLPRPAAEEFEPPREGVEELIASVWSQLLGESRIGRYDDFFALGGHSLLAAQCAAELGPRLHRDLPVAMVFSHPTVAALAGALRAMPAAPARGIAAVPRPGADVSAQVDALPDDMVAELLDELPGRSR